jgi:hypothetical protein
MNFLSECDIANCNWFGVLETYEIYEKNSKICSDYLHLCPRHNKKLNPQKWPDLLIREKK